MKKQVYADFTMPKNKYKKYNKSMCIDLGPDNKQKDYFSLVKMFNVNSSITWIFTSTGATVHNC